MPTLFVEELTALDCSYWHAERGLVGETWLVDLEVTGRLDEQSMIFDFGLLKREAKRVLKGLADHKLLIPNSSDSIAVRSSEGYVEVDMEDRRTGRIFVRCPDTAVCILPLPVIDAHRLRAPLREALMAVVPANVEDIVLDLRTERDDTAQYQYSHGLKMHAGACQRIAHGHRSRIEIYENGVRSGQWERYWADCWRDVYLANRADLVACADPDKMRFAYRSAEGEFSIELDRRRCYLLDTETTVECIAQHIAEELKLRVPGSSFVVRAYEGINKGAIARCD